MRYTSSGKVGYGLEQGIVEKHPDLTTIAELAGGSDRTHTDRVKVTDTSQVNDQPGRTEVTYRVDMHLPQPQGTLGIEITARAHHDGAIEPDSGVKRGDIHEWTSRSQQVNHRA